MKSVRIPPVNLKPEHLTYFQPHFAVEMTKPSLHSRGSGHFLNASQTIYDRNGKVDPYSITWQEEAPLFTPWFFRARRWLQRNQRLQVPAVIITDKCSDNYYHWHTEVLPSLVSFLETVSDPDWRIIVPYSCAKLAYVRESLNVFAPGRFLLTSKNQNFQAEKFLCCRKGRPVGSQDSELMRKVLEIFNQKVPAPSGGINGRKVYARRTGAAAAKRSIVNDAEVSALMVSYGYECLDFSDLDYYQQISLARQTSHLISIHGAGLTNMIFMPPGSTIYELKSKPDVRNYSNCFYSLANCFGHDYYYLICASTLDNDPIANIDNPKGHFTVDLAALKDDIERYHLY